MSSVPEDVNIQKQLTDMHIKEWLSEDVFHFKWWLLIFIIIVLFVTWYILLDKARTRAICLYAFLAAVLFMGIHEYGEELTLWDYPTDIIAIFPPLSSINLISLPLTYSLIYQHAKQRKSFIYTVLIASAVICFILEPILSWAGFYRLIHWNYFFSYPIYVGAAIITRALTIKLDCITGKNRTEVSGK